MPTPSLRSSKALAPPHYRSNIYSLAPGRDVVARGWTSLLAVSLSPRGLKSRGRFFRRVGRGRGHSGKQPGKHSRERPQGRSSTKSYQPFNPSRFHSRPGAAQVGPRRRKSRNRRRKGEKPAVPRQNPVKKRRKVEKPTDPRQKPVKWLRTLKNFVLLCGNSRREVPTFCNLPYGTRYLCEN